MSAHTPRTWEARGLTVFERGKEALSVATITGHQQAAKANARLIAAAPDLLVAARAVMTLLANTEPTYEAAYRALFKADGRDQWNLLAVAIARATGKAP